MKTRRLLPIACVAGFCVTAASAQPSLDPRALTADLPFAMALVALPRIPARDCRNADHGARGDGATLNTEAITAAVEACSKAGGGRVVVPRGIFLTGPIELKRRIELHLDRGALLRFSPRPGHYPRVRTSFEGADRVRATSPIWAKRAEDIAITGEGVIDGSGQAWRYVKKFKMTPNQWKALLASGGVVERIWIRDVQMTDIPTDAIGFHMYYGGEAADNAAAARPPMPVDEGTPQFRDIVLSHILCRGAGRAVMLEGLPEMAIRGIVLEDVRMTARKGLMAIDADAITLRRVDIVAETGPAISVRTSTNVTVDGVPFEQPVRK
jgi:polygalacturonase